MNPAPAAPEDPIRVLLESYNELNSSYITELDEIPSPLEFMRFVSLNRPFVVRGGASDVSLSSTYYCAICFSELAI
jgi:jumonji domain-containing protein 7